MLTAVPVGCIWGCIYFSHYLTHSLKAIVWHCCSLRKPQKVLKMSRGNKPHLFLWPSSAVFFLFCLSLFFFFFNLKAYNRICWLESKLYLRIDMRDLSESDGLWKGILPIWYVWQILYLKSIGISFFLLGYVLDILQLIILLTLWKWVNKRLGGIKHNKWIEILPAGIFWKILYANNWKANILHFCNY